MDVGDQNALVLATVVTDDIVLVVADDNHLLGARAD
jgi:hypothetical protein